MIYDKLLPRLGRKTTSGRFIPEIDGLRFVAIALVVFFHLAGYVAAKSPVDWAAPPETHFVAQAMAVGHYGVQLFFIISGFVLALPFATRYLAGGPRVSLRSYFLRRVTRLEPPYIVAMTVFFLALAVRESNAPPDLGPHYLASIAYVHNLVYSHPSVINVVAWSLEIEVQFYLLAPLLGLVFAIRSTVWRRAIVAGAAVALALLQWAFMSYDSRATLTLFAFGQFFLVGFLLADVFIVDWRQQPTTHWIWDLVVVLGCLAIIASWQDKLTERLLFPFAALIAYMGAFRGPVVRRALTNPYVTVIGGMCYTIYLIHYPFISVAGARTISLAFTRDFGVNFLLQALVVVPALLVVSAVYFALIERPCMERDWPQRFARQVAAIRQRTFLQPLFKLIPLPRRRDGEPRSRDAV